MTSLRQRMLEDLQIRHYSATTVRIYLHSVAEFAKHFHKPPDQLGPEHIRQYQLFLIKDKQASQSTCVQLVCALRFFYTHTLNRKDARALVKPLPAAEDQRRHGAQHGVQRQSFCGFRVRVNHAQPKACHICSDCRPDNFTIRIATPVTG